MKEFIPFLILIALQFVYTLYRAVARRKARQENQSQTASRSASAPAKTPRFAEGAAEGLRERKNYQEERPLASLRHSLQETFEGLENKIQDRFITPTQRAYEALETDSEGDFPVGKTKKTETTSTQAPSSPAFELSLPSSSKIDAEAGDAGLSPAKKVSQSGEPLTLSNLTSLSSYRLRRQLKNRRRLKEAFVFQELLGAPLSMRRGGPTPFSYSGSAPGS